ncbi:hypothetical protein BO94DRAFT_559570 [Aspergillus sclerotioniger CBS 115572]|uniref:Uncharacterized protein n=1 Tax=Aspergillus sclerotioniger CBS 115572 TaxID=1450535 RepID=A0A317VLR6_9EURO|nr:hypothetical protein BO94DRAFT_559570 [Aspergillus sclerotioniger CBS 115572]PWY75286.1 hypothetical protein BO94DRAFT_559570 [Aspergillus sclerotioniger CBS 115572]
MQVFLKLDYILWFYNILAAGYLVISGTFTFLQEKIKTLDNDVIKDSIKESIIKAIRNLLLLEISCSCLVLGVTLMMWLSWERRNNYIWLGGDWLIIAMMTVIITNLLIVVSITLIIIYKFKYEIEISIRSYKILPKLSNSI